MTDAIIDPIRSRPVAARSHTVGCSQEADHADGSDRKPDSECQQVGALEATARGEWVEGVLEAVGEGADGKYLGDVGERRREMEVEPDA